MLEVRIPYTFAREQTRLTWREVLWGAENGFFLPSDIPKVARDKLDQGSEDWRLVELVGLSNQRVEDQMEVVRALAQEESFEDTAFICDKWKYLFVKRSFETEEAEEFHKNLLDFCFEYPKDKELEKIANLKELPTSVTLEKQREETLQYLRQYLERGSIRFGPGV